MALGRSTRSHSVICCGSAVATGCEYGTVVFSQVGCGFPPVPGINSDDHLPELRLSHGSPRAKGFSQLRQLISAPGGTRTPDRLLRSLRYPRAGMSCGGENRVWLPADVERPWCCKARLEV
jgi:hypothetical protein